MAGGRQIDLLAVFTQAGLTLSKQAVNQWVKNGGDLPTDRIWQLRRLRPEWFRRSAMAKMPPSYPKPKRQTTAAIEKARKARGKPSKLTPKGPPFRPKTYGDPETSI